MTISEQLDNLRKLMRQHKIDYYFISNSDPHHNEYLPEAWKRYQYLTGFTGSNGEVLVGLDKAYFWTDGRYTEQAKLELAADLFETFIYAQGGGSAIGEFMRQNIKKGARIGVDPCALSLQQGEALQTAAKAQGQELVFLNQNLVDQIWTDQPPLKFTKISALADSYTGKSALAKLKQLRDFLQAEKQDALVLNELTAIAWLFNLRGTDVTYNPVFMSYAIVTTKQCFLFVNLNMLSPKTLDYLKNLKVEVQDYSFFYQMLSALCPEKVLLDRNTSNQAIFNALSARQLTVGTSPIPLWKACKNEVEIQGAANAHRIDALALIRFFTWLEHHKTGQTEISLATKLLEFRQMGKSFQGDSFQTISGFGPHSAIIHYHPTGATPVGPEAIMLIDSGAQYLDGTTDITRTIHLGEPTALEKQCYTLVLKGHLALKRAIFPQGTRGEQLDILARQFLWQEGLNYAHGTGHGVGAYLCVHEGPQRISTAATTTPLKLNMILSNEPGVYLAGRFGIRIENLVYVKKASLTEKEFGDFYTFEDLTLVPYARNLIDITLLSPIEIAQIDAYHTRILEELSASLEVEALKWLIETTRPL